MSIGDPMIATRVGVGRGLKELVAPLNQTFVGK